MTAILLKNDKKNHLFLKNGLIIVEIDKRYDELMRIQRYHYVLVLQTEAIWRTKCNLTKKIFFSKILKRLISLNKYKTIFLYHQFLTSKQPWSSKNAKVIGHTSTKNPLVNKANSYQFINLKFYKILNCWKTNDAKFEKFSEHL